VEISTVVEIYRIEVQVGFWVTFAVTAIYGLLAPWYKSDTGKAFFSLLAALTLLLGNSVLGIYFGRAEWRTWSGATLFGLYCLAMIFIGYHIFKAQVMRYYTKRKDREWQL